MHSKVLNAKFRSGRTPRLAGDGSGRMALIVEAPGVGKTSPRRKFTADAYT